MTNHGTEWTEEEVQQLEQHADPISDATENARMRLMAEKARQQLQKSNKEQEEADQDWQGAVAELQAQ